MEHVEEFVHNMTGIHFDEGNEEHVAEREDGVQKFEPSILNN